MQSFDRWVLVFVLMLTTALSPVAAAPDERVDPGEDEGLLMAARIPPNSASLLKFFRRRTSTSAEQERLAGMIRRLGDPAFPVREQASNDLLAAGPAALQVLRGARTDPDPEIRRRVRVCIDAIENGPSAAQAAAAARLIKLHRPREAPAVLLEYLPFAMDSTVEEEVLGALLTLGVRTGTADPALLSALQDPAPVRRAAAGLVLGRFGSPEQRDLVRRLLRDADARVRLRAAQGLLAARDPKAIPALLYLLGEGPLEMAQHAEDSLVRIAGNQASSLTEDPATRRKCHDAFSTWWKVNESTLDLAKADVEVSHLHTGHRARAMGRRFMETLLQGDLAAFRKTMDVPFFNEGGQLITTREALDKEFGEDVVQNVKRLKMQFTLKNSVRLEEYSRIASEKEKGNLNQLPRQPEVHAVYMQLRTEGGGLLVQDIALLVRVVGGRARVVGIGHGKPAK